MNSVNIVGNLAFDPELKYINDTKLCNMSVAVSKKYKKGEEWVDEVAFIPVTVWGNQAKACGEYLKKGSKVGVSGEIKQERWEKDGKKQSKLILNARGVEFLSPKSENQQSAPAQSPAPAAGGDDPANLPF